MDGQIEVTEDAQADTATWVSTSEFDSVGFHPLLNGWAIIQCHCYPFVKR